jgi:phosphatidylglycerol---prolipoprotein diacylglyceryl transferase
VHPFVDIGGLRLATHDVFSLLALAVGFGIYYRDLRRRRLLEPRIVLISLGALLGAAVGARLLLAWENPAYWTENAGRVPLSALLEHSNKSIIGAIVGAWLAIAIAKRALGYRRSTGDSYAFALPIGMAIGRIGCFLSELPLGKPTDLPWGISVSPQAAAAFPDCPGCELPMHPTMLYEIAFNLLAVALLWHYRHRFVINGDLIRGYLLAAALFRFAVEFIRTSPEQVAGLTAPQLVLIPFLVYLALHFVRQARSGVYRVPPAPMPATA